MDKGELKDAVREALFDCDPKVEYGPHGVEIWWVRLDEVEDKVEKAIDGIELGERCF